MKIVQVQLDGSVDQIGAGMFKLADGATLDLYVSGSVKSVGHLTMGSKASPSSFRLYVGGTEPLLIAVGNQEFYGMVFAPTAVVSFVGRALVRGGMVARTLKSTGLLEVYYERPDKTPADKKICPPKPPSKDTPKDPGKPWGDPDDIYK